MLMSLADGKVVALLEGGYFMSSLAGVYFFADCVGIIKSQP